MDTGRRYAANALGLLAAALAPDSRKIRGLAIGAFGVAIAAALAVPLPHIDWNAPGARESIALAAVFAAGVLASVAGFAFSAVAGAMVVHLYSDPVETVRILLVSSITIQAYCMARLFKRIDWREVAPYLLGGIITVPLGVFVLMRVSLSVYATVVGLFLIAYGLYALKQPLKIETRGGRAIDAAIGAMGGITGGIAALPGAFVAIWCSARGLPKERQRAICQPYIFFMQIVTLACLQYASAAHFSRIAGLWMFVPVSLVAAGLGFSIFQRLSNEQFKNVVLVLLIASGVLMTAHG